MSPMQRVGLPSAPTLLLKRYRTASIKSRCRCAQESLEAAYYPMESHDQMLNILYFLLLTHWKRRPKWSCMKIQYEDPVNRPVPALPVLPLDNGMDA